MTFYLQNPHLFTGLSAGANIVSMINSVEQNASDWGITGAVQLFNNKVTVAKIYSHYAQGGSIQSEGYDISTAASILKLVKSDDICINLRRAFGGRCLPIIRSDQICMPSIGGVIFDGNDRLHL